jgi:hypothetical protein
MKKRRKLNWKKQRLKRNVRRGVRRREFMLMKWEGSTQLLTEVLYM